MISRVLGSMIAVTVLVGCTTTDGPTAVVAPRLVTRAYLEPVAVDRGRQEYGPNYERFPPIMTKRTGYPTQEQAEAALRLSRWTSAPIRDFITKVGIKPISVSAELTDARADRVRLFACRPGGLDGITGRVRQYRGPVVVCASDLIASDGRVLARVPLNFYYWRQAWRVHDPVPSYRPVPWAAEEPSPPANPWSWLPWQDRY